MILAEYIIVLLHTGVLGRNEDFLYDSTEWSPEFIIKWKKEEKSMLFFKKKGDMDKHMITSKVKMKKKNEP